MHRAVSLIALLFLFALSCSSEKPGVSNAQKAPAGEKSKNPEVSQQASTASGGSYSLKISPESVSRRSTIYLTPQGFTQNNAKIEWRVNGRQTTSPASNQFNAMEARKGDTIQAKATIQGREIYSNELQIKNAPPEIISARIVPGGSEKGGTLSVEASASDIDGDGVTLAYEWTKNGEPAGSGNHIQVPLKRGDKVRVKITPFDGEAYGREKTLENEIGNMPPIITYDKKFSFDGSVWASQIKATDPDGDPLTYALKDAPQGMTITQNGLITWRVPADFRGKQPATVSVTDGHDGEAVYHLTVVITEESAVKRSR